MALNDEEKELIEAIESDRYEVGKNLLTVELLQNLQEATRNTMSEASTKVSICLMIAIIWLSVYRDFRIENSLHLV